MKDDQPPMKYIMFILNLVTLYLSIFRFVPLKSRLRLTLVWASPINSFNP